MERFRKIVVCGVGLIGGSFAMALRQAGAADEIVGVGRGRATLDEARQRGVIDRHTDDWADALAGADLLLLAMPVGQTANILRQAAPHLAPQTVVSDAGSTKQDVVVAAREALGGKVGQFVPAHPIAGAEKSGVAASQADLYRGKRTILTPLAENPPASVALVRRAWECCGAQVGELTPEAHDRIFAAVSHLPHLLAFAMVHAIAGRADAQELFSFAASGFRDFTRIAGSHPEMWRDICIANRTALIAELDAYQAELLRAKVLLAQADAAGLETLFAEARSARNTWMATRQDT